MRGLFIVLIAALAGVFSRLRNRDIFLTPDPDLVPAGAQFPCIGIRDGTTLTSELQGDVNQDTLLVEIYYYDRLVPGNQCILDFLKKGELVADKLTGITLTGYERGVSRYRQTPIKVMYTKAGLILRKGLFFEYEKED